MLSSKFNSMISLKWLCQTSTPEYFQHLNGLFSKLVLHNIKVLSHCNFLKLFLAGLCSKNNGESHVKKMFLSNCWPAIQISYVAVRQWLEILINGFLIKNVLAVGGWSWIVVDIFWLVVVGGGWWWIYFSLTQRKTRVLKSLLIKLTKNIWPTLLKRDSNTSVSLWILLNF